MSTTDELHVNHWECYFDDTLQERFYCSWWDPGTANHWRHRRFMSPVLDVLQNRADSWLTLGDGAGHDSWFLLNDGFADVLSTDIGSAALRRSLAEGHIKKYAQVNAESLPFGDGQFDGVLCKEALHHMRRPYQALYEMVRTARRAVVLIEPQDPWADFPTRTGPAVAAYEQVGNYVYTLSVREVQKFALGLNLPGYAVRNLLDVYIEGCEFARADPVDPLFQRMTATVAALQARCEQQQEKWNYLQVILFKDAALLEDAAVAARLRAQGWQVERTDTNPLLRPAGAAG
jgi:ubiquinone/menaquinone biosynthesis C-methylase UbiE